MDQQKTGRFLKELRGEKALTQEQLAGRLAVSSRSISRWENGVTMPDFDLLIELSKLYGVEVGEILDGERRDGSADGQTEETLLKIADYNNAEREFSLKKLRFACLAGLAGMAVYLTVELAGLSQVRPYMIFADMALGFVTGALLTGVILTSRYGARLRAAKKKLWGRVTHRGEEK